jgi:hypothetical protein
VEKMPDDMAEKQNKIILYSTKDGNVDVDVYFWDETFWLTQDSIAALFDVQRPAITKHLKNIFESDELIEKSVCSILERTAADGKTYSTKFYNLDAIIAVGYRVNSKQATQFRRWATETLKQYIIKGFVLNDDMLKNGKPFGKDYFDELLERIKEIRTSERRFYQKITDIYSQCSYDYMRDSEMTANFFKTVQNKLLFAITGYTAPEIISNRANSAKLNMGLQTWKNAPDGKILQSDIVVSKNYLLQEELSGLNDIVNMYLDYAENQAKRHRLMSMEDWVSRLDAFLQFNEYDLLHNKGTVERKVVDELAKEEFRKYRVIQDEKYISDFDKSTRKYLMDKE